MLGRGPGSGSALEGSHAPTGGWAGLFTGSGSKQVPEAVQLPSYVCKLRGPAGHLPGAPGGGGPCGCSEAVEGAVVDQPAELEQSSGSVRVEVWSLLALTGEGVEVRAQDAVAVGAGGEDDGCLGGAGLFGPAPAWLACGPGSAGGAQHAGDGRDNDGERGLFGAGQSDSCAQCWAGEHDQGRSHLSTLRDGQWLGQVRKGTVPAGEAPAAAQGERGACRARRRAASRSFQDTSPSVRPMRRASSCARGVVMRPSGAWSSSPSSLSTASLR